MGMAEDEGKNNIIIEISVINCLKRHHTCHVLKFLIFRPQRVWVWLRMRAKITSDLKSMSLIYLKLPRMPYFEVFNISHSEGIGYG